MGECNLGVMAIVMMGIASLIVGGVAGFVVGVHLRIDDALEVEEEREQTLAAIRRFQEYLECEPTTQYMRVYPLESELALLTMRIEGRLHRARQELKGVRRVRERQEAWAGFQQAFGGECCRN